MSEPTGEAAGCASESRDDHAQATANPGSPAPSHGEPDPPVAYDADTAVAATSTVASPAHTPQSESSASSNQETSPSGDSSDGVPPASSTVARLGSTQQDYLYTMRHVEDKAKQALDNISTLTSFKSTILARTAVYDSADGVRHSLSFFRRRFKWFDFDESDLEQTTTYYCCDQQGLHNVHLTGYLIMCHRVDGRYVFRSCVAEFYEQVTFDQLAYKVLASSTSIVGGIAASAATGAAMAWPTDAFTWGTGSVVGGLAGAVAGVVGAVFVNVDADSKEKQIEKKLGTGLYNASTSRINSHGIMEVLLLHYLLADQKYNIDGTRVRIAGVTAHEYNSAGQPTGRTTKSCSEAIESISGDSTSTCGAIKPASSPVLLERRETRRRNNRDGTMPMAKISAPHLAAEPRRLKSKREALEREMLLRARTGSLFDFIPNPTSSASERRPNPSKRRQRCQGEKQAHATGVNSGKREIAGIRRLSHGSGDRTLVSKASHAGNACKDVMPTAAVRSRLQETLHRHRHFADPVTSQREALRSLQAKNSLYPTLRFAQPWDGMDFDPLDEYLSSSSSPFSSGDEASKGDGSESGDEVINFGDKGGRDKLHPRHGRGRGRGRGRAGRSPAAPEARGASTAATAAIAKGQTAEIGGDLERKKNPSLRREQRERKRDLRHRRRRLTQRRRAFNAAALAAEEEEREMGAAAAAQAAAAEAAAKLNWRPAQVDVAKLKHFRYSKVKGTMALGSEEDWVSDGLYEGSSTAATEILPGRSFPAEFYGSGARPRFYDLYRLVHRQQQTVDDSQVLEEEEFTPRRLFLRDTMKRAISPSPTLMRSKKCPDTLDLGFQGLGDKIGLALAPTLRFLPNLASIVLRDNRLTDLSLNDILAEAVGLKSLTSLDLSSNKIDNSALVLRAYVASSSCSLQKLSLSNADVDDDECTSLMEALVGNSSIRMLDLSHNLIGDKETYNFVRPDYTTGGEAVADMLEANITLRCLDLSWNSIRMASGVSLGKSLAHNSALIELKLAHNSLAESGIQAIAQSLRSNGSLRLLDISFNNMKPKSAMVLANALLDNSSLDHLMMSHNNVGRRGAKAVFMALRQRARDGVELLVDLQSCELGSDTGDELFDMYSPSGRYDLNMSKPYDYMVARMLLDIANKSEGLEFTGVEYAAGDKGSWKPLHLSRRAPSSISSSSRRKSRLGDPLERHIADSFGEKVLGTTGVNRSKGGDGDWRVPAGMLLKYCRTDTQPEPEIARPVGEARPLEIERFLNELGLDPTPTISIRLCEAFNAARRKEWMRQQRGSGEHGSASSYHSGGRGREHVEDATESRLAEGEEREGLDESDEKINIASGSRASQSTSAASAPRPSRSSGRSRPTSARPAAERHAFGPSEPKGLSSPGSPRSVLTPGGGRAVHTGTGRLVTPFDVATHLFDLLFLEADIDQSGCIDHAEFGSLLRSLGRDIGPDVARHCIVSYDIDRSNTIEAAEFVDFMTHEFLAPALPPPGVICETTSNTAWEIPREGRLKMTVVADYVAPAPIEVASQEAVDALISNIKYSAKTEQDLLEMFQLATEGTDFYMTSLSAQALIDEWNNGMNLVKILEIMVPQMSSDRNAVSLIENNLTYSQKLELRNTLGQAWGPLVGNPTGTYCLDMSDGRHLVAAKRLAMINHTEKNHGITGAAGRRDTSQRGHWNNFRNETFNGLPFAGRGMEGRWFVSNPPTGKVRLDYVSTARPFPGTKPLSDRRFRQLLSHLDLGDMKRSTRYPFLFGADPEELSMATVAAAAAAARIGSSARTSTTESVHGRASTASRSLQAGGVKTTTIVTAPATPQSKRAKQERGRGETPATQPRLTSADAANVAQGPMLFSPRLVLKPLMIGPAAPIAMGEDTLDGAHSIQSASSCRGSTGVDDGSGGGSQESATLLEIREAHAMIKEGLLRTITPDQVLAFHAEYQVTSKHERRRAWAIVELGQPLVPDEDTLSSRASAAAGDGAGKPGKHRNDAPRGSGGYPPDTIMSKGEGVVRAAVEGEMENETGAEPEDVDDQAAMAASAGAVATAEAGKSEVAEFVDSKTSFGDKQKPLYHMPLKWRKLVGKPQYTQDYKLALSKLCELRVQVLQHWLTAKQVITTMNFFPRCDYLRVIVATTLFGRLVDLENLDLILDEFTQAECEEFLWRLGPLNCYNPMKPDRSYDLDLAHRDDREICKVLARLAADEPGENWVGEQYSWSYAQRPVPGWELPLSWTTPDNGQNGGPRHCGRLTLRYSSDPATGCAPIWKLRESLMARVLAGEKPQKLFSHRHRLAFELRARQDRIVGPAARRAIEQRAWNLASSSTPPSKLGLDVGRASRRAIEQRAWNVDVPKKGAGAKEQTLCFNDSQKAYDSVDRELIRKVLARAGIPAAMIDVMRKFHSEIQARVRMDVEDLSDWFPVTQRKTETLVMRVKKRRPSQPPPSSPSPPHPPPLIVEAAGQREGAPAFVVMLPLAEAKVAQEALTFVQAILACVYAIAGIVKGIKGNDRAASQLLKRVEAIEPPMRDIQKKGTHLPSTSESLRQLLETVQNTRDALDKYAMTCKAWRIVKQKKISKKFERLGVKLTMEMVVVTSAIAIARAQPSPAPKATAYAVVENA
eukprot:g4411.t1